MKPGRRLRVFAVAFISEFLLIAAWMSTDLEDIVPTVRRQAATVKRHAAAVIKAAPMPQIVLPVEASYRTLELHAFDDQAELKKWEEKPFRGHSRYEIVEEGGVRFVRSSSEAASSALYLKDLHYQPAADLYIEWDWRAVRFPVKRDGTRLANRGEDDFAARIYVVFPGTNFFNTNVIEYIWDEKLPEDTVASSPFSDRVKLVVVRSGPAPTENGGWRHERRNILSDYHRFYGELPKRELGAIGFMSDSDNTGSSSAADFKNFALTRKLSK
jgi:hypothetical protein